LLLRPPGGSGGKGKGKGRAEVQGPSGAPGISGMGRAMQARHRQQPQGLGALISAGKNILRSIFAGAALLALPVDAQEHRFEADPVVTVRENLVACDVLSQLQRVIGNPRFLLAGECDPLRAGDRVRVYARRGPYVCIYPHDTISPCKWTHEKPLSK
jgi:hypothetical protein